MPISREVSLTVSASERYLQLSTSESESTSICYRRQIFEIDVASCLFLQLHSDTVMFHALSDTGSLIALVVRLSNTVPPEEGS